MSWVMKEFGEGDGVVYVDKPEDALWKAVRVDWWRGGWGIWSQGAGVCWDVWVGGGCGMRLRGFWRDDMFNIKQTIRGMV